MGRSLFSYDELEGQDLEDWNDLNFAIQNEDESDALEVVGRANPIITWAYDLQEQETLARAALNRKLFDAVIAMAKKDGYVTSEEIEEAKASAVN